MNINFKLSQNSKHYSSNSKLHNNKRLCQDQVRLLEASFNANKKLDPERKLQLAHQLGVPPRQIAIWYQNKRARWKNQSLELDYGTLHIRLETTLAQKRQLEKEVHSLQVELQKSQAEISLINAFMINQVQHVQAPQVQPPNCDEGGSSSLHDDHMNCSAWMNDHEQQAIRVLDQELYAFLMGTN